MSIGIYACNPNTINTKELLSYIYCPNDVDNFIIERSYSEKYFPNNGWDIMVRIIRKPNIGYIVTGDHIWIDHLALEQSLEFSTKLFNDMRELRLKVKNIEPSAIGKCIDCGCKFSNNHCYEQMCFGCRNRYIEKKIKDKDPATMASIKELEDMLKTIIIK